MTTALLAFWTCCVSGDAPGINAIRSLRKKEAVHKRAVATKKSGIIVSGELFGMGHSGRLGLAGKLAAPHHHHPSASASVTAPKTFMPLAGSEPKLSQAATLATRILEFPTSTESKHPSVKAAAVAPEMQLCSVNVSDYEIQKFLPLLTQMTGLNIILMASSPAKVTMHVEKMRFIDVMRHVCALTGFAYLKASDAYILAPVETLKGAYKDEWLAAHPEAPPKQADPVKEPEPILTRTFTANYIKAGQLVEAIKKLVPKDLDVVAGPSQDTPSISSVDPSEKTGQSSVSVSQDSAGPATRTIILRGTQASIATALDIAKQLDIPRSQVSISVTIHDISDDAVKDLGLSWNFSNLTLSETPSANGIGVGKVTRSPMTFDAAIAALETRDVARLMASPNVSLLDGEKAFILIGDRINYPVLTGYTSTNSPIFSVNTERVGIYLQVAASISSDGYITLTLYPQVSSITGYLNVNGASYPQVSSREAQTTLRVKSGDTIVLGGLLQDTDLMNVDKVPILSSIPFFGELFKHRTKTKNKSQVIITIRPVVIPQAPK